MIEAEDPILVRMGVKRVYYDFRVVESLQDIVETRLINFATIDRQGKEEIDAIAWMAKTLAASGLPKYRAALGELTKSSYPKKVRKYAKKYLEALNETVLIETT